MDNPSVNFFGGKRKLIRWLRSFKTPTKKPKPSPGKQAIGGLLMGMGVICIAFVLVAWVLLAVIAPSLPASTASLAKSEGAANLSAMALRNFLPGHDVRIERQFAYNLKLYVDRKPFEDIPYPDRVAIMAKIGQLWCGNIGYQWLARVSVFDVRSGKKLFSHGCAIGMLKEALFK